ncbi:MAG: tape measure protein [Gammaproteobacteria bacterium]|nr:tape measure protein [Gammaproteobacteria bacterium]
MSGVIVDVDARTEKAERDLQQINKSLRGIETSASNAGKTISRAFVGIGAALTAHFSVSQVSGISTEFTNLSNQIAVVTGRTRELNKVQSELFNIAENTRASISNTVSTFGSLGRSLRGVESSNTKILTVTKAIQQATALSGASSESAKAAIVQLGQGLAAGALRGQELMSVMEQLPRAAIAIADGLEVPLGALRKLGESGKLTSEQVFNALLQQSEKIGQEFKSLAPTVQQSKNLLTDSLKIYISELDRGMGLSDRMGSSLQGWSKKIREASKGAYDLGNRIAYNLTIFKREIKQFVGPFANIGIAIAKQFKKALPKAFLTLTFEAMYRDVIRDLDKFTGGYISAWKRFKFIDIIKIESDVEIAIRTLKRLHPKYWAAGGFDVLSLKHFFSAENLNLYLRALQSLADAIESNIRSAASVFKSLAINIRFGTEAMLRFVGIIPESLVMFRVGHLKPFLKTVIEIARAITGTSLEFYRVGRLISEGLFPDIISVFRAMGDIMQQLFGRITSSSRLAKAIGYIKTFADSVMRLFEKVYMSVVGGSTWTDTMKGIYEKARSFLGKTRKALASFGEFVMTQFKKLADKNLWSKVGIAIHTAIFSIIPVAAWIIRSVIDIVTTSIVASLGMIGYLWAKTFNSLAEVAPKSIAKMIRRVRDFGLELTVLFAGVVIAVGRLLKALLWVVAALGKLFVMGAVFSFHALIYEISRLTEYLRGDAVHDIIDFGKKVIDVFAEIYDKVIGNSYWTDLIENIVNTSNSLWDSVKGGFFKFYNNIVSLFKSLNKRASLPTFEFKSSVSIPFIEDKSLLTRMKDRILEMYADVAERFPTMITGAVLAVAGIAVSLLFPAGEIKKALLSGIFLALIKAGTLIASALGKGVLDVNFVTSLARSAGNAVGNFIGGILRDLPATFDLLLGAAINFIRGVFEAVLTQIPILGTAIKGIFGILDATGTSGVAGVIGTLFLGKYIANVLGFFGLFTTPMAKMKGIMGKLYTVVSGKGGVLSQLVFGRLGPTAGIAMVLGVLDILGAFDTLFEDSPLFHLAAQGGIVALMLGGNGAIQYAKNFAIDKILSPIGDALRRGAINMGFGQILANAMVTGQEGFVASTLAFVTSAIQSVGSRIVSFVAPLASKTYDYLQILLLGPDPAATIAKMKLYLIAAMDSGKALLSGIGAFLSPLLASMGSFFKGLGAQVSGLFSQVQTASVRAASTATSVGGRNGIFGRVIFGAAGRTGLVLAIIALLTLFSSSASAADKEITNLAGNNRIGQAASSLKQDWEDIRDNNPLAAAGITALGVFTTLGVFLAYKFRRDVLTSMLSAFNPKIAYNFGFSSLKTIAKIKSAMLSLGRVIATSFVAFEAGSAIGEAFGGEEGSMIGGTIGVLIAEGLIRAFGGTFKKIFSWRLIWPIITGAFAFIGKALIGLIFSKIAAVVSIVGILGLLLFGKKGEFWNDIGKAIQWVKELIGLSTEASRIDSKSGISNEALGFANLNQIDVAHSLEGIDFDKISDRQTERLEAKLNEVNDAILEAQEEASFTKDGKIVEDTKKSLEILLKGTKNYVDKLTSQSLPSYDEIGAALDSFKFTKEATLFDSILLNYRQGALDVLYGLKDVAISLKGLPDDIEKRERAILADSKLTKFNARFVDDDPILNSIIKAQKDFGEPGKDANITSEEEQKLVDLTAAYIRNLKIASEERIGLFGNRQAFNVEADSYKQMAESAAVLNSEFAKLKRLSDRRNEVEAFNKDIKQISNNLSLIGINIKTSELFAEDSDALDRVRILGQTARDVTENLKNLASVEEMREYLITLSSVKKELGEIKERAENAGKSMQTIALQSLEGLGDSLFSEETVRRLPETLSKAITELSREYKDNSGFLDLEFRPDAVSTAKFRRDTELKMLNLKKSIHEIMLDPSNIGGAKELAEGLGLDFDSLLKHKGIPGIVDALSDVLALQHDIDLSKLLGDGEKYRDASLALKKYMELLTKAPQTLDTLLSDFSTLGGDLSVGDFVTLDSSTLSRMRELSTGLHELNYELAEMGENFTSEELKQKMEDRLNLMAEASKLNLENLYTTPQRILDGLGRAGISDEKLVALLPEGTFREFLALDTTIEDLRAKLQDPRNADSFETIAKQLRDALLTVDSLENRLKHANLSIADERDTVNSLTRSETIGKITEVFPQMQGFTDSLNQLPLTDLRNLLTSSLDFKQKFSDADFGVDELSAEQEKQIRDAFVKAFAVSQEASNFGLTAKSLLLDSGVDFKESAYNLVTETADKQIQQLATELRDAKAQLSAGGNAATRIAAQQLVNQKSRELSDALEAATYDVKEEAYKAGGTYFGNIKSGFQSAFTDGLKGTKSEEASTWVTFRDSILDMFTSNVIETFSGGFSDSMFAPIKDSIMSAGAELFSAGSAEGEGLTDTFADGMGAVFSSMKTTLADGASSIYDYLSEIDWSQVWSTVTSFFGFSGGGSILTAATGGRLVGPGTGTSDSMLARVSNGEYIINAAATRRNLDLLEAINSGSVSSYATGGLVGPNPTMTDNARKSSVNINSKSKTSQVFNLNVTGDISRQTRSEIVQMIPQIAQGVGAYNNEFG